MKHNFWWKNALDTKNSLVSVIRALRPQNNQKWSAKFRTGYGAPKRMTAVEVGKRDFNIKKSVNEFEWPQTEVDRDSWQSKMYKDKISKEPE